jgi:membrane protein DedA with SNARE-associated domain
MFVGYLVFRGHLTYVPALVAAWAGSATGITISYAVGRAVGSQGISKLGRLLHWRVDHVERAAEWVRRWGPYLILFAYFLPGVRHVGALMLGASSVAFGTFARFAYTGAGIWVGAFISLGYLFGEEWSRLSPLVHRSALLIAIVAMLLALGAVVLWKRRLNRPTPASATEATDE